jgi:hypothetical protein
VIRKAVRADELRLLQTVSQVAATEMNLVRGFPKIQQLTRRLVAWEDMGLCRVDPSKRELVVVADTAATADAPTGRFDMDVGPAADCERAGRAVLIRHPRPGDRARRPHARRRDRRSAQTGRPAVGLWTVPLRSPAPRIYGTLPTSLLAAGLMPRYRTRSIQWCG